MQTEQRVGIGDGKSLAQAEAERAKCPDVVHENLNALCVCGHRNGDHEAVSPHACTADACTGDLSDNTPSCRSYRPVRDAAQPHPSEFCPCSKCRGADWIRIVRNADGLDELV